MRAIAIAGAVASLGVSLLGACDNAPNGATVTRLAKYPFSEPLVLLDHKTHHTGPFLADTYTVANYKIAKSDLNSFVASCEKYSFARRDPNTIPQDLQARIPSMQNSAVCVKEGKENGRHVFYLGPDGLHYIYHAT